MFQTDKFWIFGDKIMNVATEICSWQLSAKYDNDKKETLLKTFFLIIELDQFQSLKNSLILVR